MGSLGRPQRHYEPAAHSELLDQRRGDVTIKYGPSEPDCFCIGDET
jgi:hypothetical protein